MEEEVRLGNRDRGWNDPPSMAFCKGSQAQSSPKRNLLNQRVAMPQNYASPTKPVQAQQPPSAGPPRPSFQHTSPPPQHHAVSSAASPQQGSLPPPPLGNSQSGSPPLSSVKGKTSSESLGVGKRDGGDSAEVDVSCETTLAMLKVVLEQCGSSLQKRVTTDIERRLKVLQSSWESGKLSLPVQQRTAKLASDLKTRRYDSAHELHLSLMMDYVSEVSQWMVGVKRLIHEARQILPPDSSKPDAPKDEDARATSTPGPGLPSHDQEHPSLDPTKVMDDGDASTQPCPGVPGQNQDLKQTTAGKGDATAVGRPTEGSVHGDGLGDGDVMEEQETEIKNEPVTRSGEAVEGEGMLSKDVEQLDINQS